MLSPILNPMQKDLLLELLNIHIGQAANTLSEMIDQRVILSVPEMEVVTDFSIKIFDILYPGQTLINDILISSFKFGFNFNGKAFIIFPTSNARALINACIRQMDENEITDDNKTFDDSDFDIIKEISNVILNSLIGEFGNLLDVRMEYTTPDIHLAQISPHEQVISLPKDIQLLVLHTKFSLSGNSMSGTILVALSTDSISMLTVKIDEMLGELNE